MTAILTIKILGMAAKGMNVTDIAKKLNLGRYSVHRIFELADKQGLLGAPIPDPRRSRSLCAQRMAVPSARIRRRYADGESRGEIAESENIPVHYVDAAIGGRKSCSTIASLRILKKIVDGRSQSEVARELGVGHSTVQRVEEAAIKVGLMKPVDSVELSRRASIGRIGEPTRERIPAKIHLMLVFRVLQHFQSGGTWSTARNGFDLREEDANRFIAAAKEVGILK